MAAAESSTGTIMRMCKLSQIWSFLSVAVAVRKVNFQVRHGEGSSVIFVSFPGVCCFLVLQAERRFKLPYKETMSKNRA